MAAKMVELHGGDHDDYSITQATITLYLITCRTEEIRDSVVQRGIYTIPEARVQFTVHEWRPRFGMGHDPSTHQVWVQIIGLPLQAWTESEIKAVLRHLGHPLQIMSFGREAEHFRDITALIATKHPTRIPLTYVYRGGDYSTRVDILIMSSRPWEDSYFPPPGYPPLRDCLPSQPQNQPLNQPLNQSSPRHSSSSSSDDAPSEPTIDLSS